MVLYVCLLTKKLTRALLGVGSETGGGICIIESNGCSDFRNVSYFSWLQMPAAVRSGGERLPFLFSCFQKVEKIFRGRQDADPKKS